MATSDQRLQALESLAAMDQETPASSRATRDAAASSVAVLRAQCRSDPVLPETFVERGLPVQDPCT